MMGVGDHGKVTSEDNFKGKIMWSWTLGNIAISNDFLLVGFVNTNCAYWNESTQEDSEEGDAH
jgi:hypothetical protein